MKEAFIRERPPKHSIICDMPLLRSSHNVDVVTCLRGNLKGPRAQRLFSMFRSARLEMEK